MRDKIAEIIGFSPELTTSQKVDQILTLLEKCPAMEIEDCPWGKENVEFRKILLKGINRQSEFREVLLRGMNRQLEGIKVEEECPNCKGNGIVVFDNYGTVADCLCKTGKIYRPATLEEIIAWLKMFILCCEQHPDKQALILPSGGRLVLKK